MIPLDVLSESERNRVRITAVKAMQLRDGWGQTLVKVETDAGISGIGEAGATGATVRAHLRDIETILIGEDPLTIEKLYYRMMNRMHTYRAHIPTVSGVDIALWDLAGKILGRPVCELLTGKFRDQVTLYYCGGPESMTDRTVCEEWARRVKEHPHGYRSVKFGIEPLQGYGLPQNRFVSAELSQMLTATELGVIRRGFELVREALGSDIDIMIHSHNEWDLPSALGLSQAAESIQTLWLEDPMAVWYSDSWKLLRQQSRVRIATGEKLESPREFLPFIANGGVDVIHPDLCFAGGITGCRRIADLAELYYIPVATHNVGTMVHQMATVHFGASVRGFIMSETRIHEKPTASEMVEEDFVVVDGKQAVPTGPGLGVTLIPEAVRANLLDGESYWD